MDYDNLRNLLGEWAKLKPDQCLVHRISGRLIATEVMGDFAEWYIVEGGSNNAADSILLGAVMRAIEQIEPPMEFSIGYENPGDEVAGYACTLYQWNRGDTDEWYSDSRVANPAIGLLTAYLKFLRSDDKEAG